MSIGLRLGADFISASVVVPPYRLKKAPVLVGAFLIWCPQAFSRLSRSSDELGVVQGGIEAAGGEQAFVGALLLHLPVPDD